jgi:hypothetical protein
MFSLIRHFEEGGATTDPNGLASLAATPATTTTPTTTSTPAPAAQTTAPATTNTATTTPAPAANTATTTDILGNPSSGAMNYFNTAQAQAPQAQVSQQADQTFQTANNAAQQGLGGLSILAEQYSSPYGVGALPTFHNDIERNNQQQLSYDSATGLFSPVLTSNQFNDPYENYWMYHGSSTDMADLLSQYQAAGHTDTPDWATNPRLDVLSTLWSGSNATPISWKDAWNRTIPTTDQAPEGYFDALAAYNTGMSQWNPTIDKDQFNTAAYADYNAPAYNAMHQGVYDNLSPLKQLYIPPKLAAQLSQQRAEGLAQAQRQYAQQKLNNTTYASTYGGSADQANSDLDRLWEEMQARAAADEAQQNAYQSTIDYNTNEYTSNPYSSYAGYSPSAYTVAAYEPTSTYQPTNTNIGMGGISGSPNMGGGIAGPKLASGGLATLRYK